MTDELKEDREEPKKSYRMKLGTDYRYHFEDPELRKKAGDKAEFEWIETTFVEAGFIGQSSV